MVAGIKGKCYPTEQPRRAMRSLHSGAACAGAHALIFFSRLPRFEHDEEVGVVILQVLSPHEADHIFVVEIAQDDRNIFEVGSSCRFYTVMSARAL